MIMSLLGFVFSKIMGRELNKSEMLEDPFIQFRKWYQFAKRIKIIPFYNRMVLSTVRKDRLPSSRVVLLKMFDNRGFVFFTNYRSNKAIDIQNNAATSILFYWPLIERQVRINGSVEKTSRKDSKEYFRTRPRKSQIGAWASEQSSILDCRKDFENRILKYTEKYRGKDVPCPPYWGGYRLVPTSFDFWQARMNRLHDRFSYIINNNEWVVNRLSP